MWGKRPKRSKADALFSQYVRNKAEWKCEYCFKDFTDNPGSLDCSHYFSRGKGGIRFDERNCMALCKYHHKYLGHGDGKDLYKAMMIRKLGSQNSFDRLEFDSNQYYKWREDEALLYVKALLRDV